jgi:hypothetical protein
MNAKTFHARICLSEAADALNRDDYAPEYKVKRIKQERADYVEAFDNPDDAEAGVLSQFDEMLKQLPETYEQ